MRLAQIANLKCFGYSLLEKCRQTKSNVRSQPGGPSAAGLSRIAYVFAPAEERAAELKLQKLNKRKTEMQNGDFLKSARQRRLKLRSTDEIVSRVER
jgi:hypothetical protein